MISVYIFIAAVESDIYRRAADRARLILLHLQLSRFPVHRETLAVSAQFLNSRGKNAKRRACCRIPTQSIGRISLEEIT